MDFCSRPPPPPPNPTPLESGGTCMLSFPISGIGNHWFLQQQKNTPFPRRSWEISQDKHPKSTPYPKKMGTRMRPIICSSEGPSFCFSKQLKNLLLQQSNLWMQCWNEIILPLVILILCWSELSPLQWGLKTGICCFHTCYIRQKKMQISKPL